jgi:hypothetical protein
MRRPPCGVAFSFPLQLTPAHARAARKKAAPQGGPFFGEPYDVNDQPRPGPMPLPSRGPPPFMPRSPLRPIF